MRIAFLGLGIMGSRMAANLARAGFELTVWNRTPATAEAFGVEHGVAVAPTPFEAAQAAEIVITMVLDGAQVQSVLLDPHTGAAAGAWPGTLFVDCSTIGPSASARIAAALGRSRSGASSDRRPGHRLVARREGGDADIHGRRKPTGVRARTARIGCDGKAIVHAGPPGTVR